MLAKLLWALEMQEASRWSQLNGWASLQLGFSPDIGAELLRAHLENKLGRGVSCERIVTVNSRYASFKISAECKDVGDMNHVKLESLLIGGGASILPHISLQSPLLPGVCHNQLLENCDILCLQETFLAKQDLKGLNSISEFSWCWRVHHWPQSGYKKGQNSRRCGNSVE